MPDNYLPLTRGEDEQAVFSCDRGCYGFQLLRPKATVTIVQPEKALQR